MRFLIFYADILYIGGYWSNYYLNIPLLYFYGVFVYMRSYYNAKSSRRTEKEFVQRKKFWKNWIFLFGKIGGCVSIYIDLSKITKSGRVNSIPY